jgi:hypothetical protein
LEEPILFLSTYKAKTETKNQTRQPGAKVSEKPLKVLAWKIFTVKLLATLPNLGEPASRNKTFAALHFQKKPKNYLAGQNLKT